LTPAQHQVLENVARKFRTILAVPLVIKDEIYGGISLHYPEPRPFSPEEIALTVSFAHQAALAIENARLRAQAEQAAAAAERSRLARDLHDAVTQTLFSTSLIAEVLPRLWERNQPEARRRLEELRQLTRGALAEMRTLLLELRPLALTNAPLPDLLRQLAEAINGRARVPISLTISGEGALPPDVKIAFYRIAQEALNNVIKHAGVRQAAVRLHLTHANGETVAVELGVSDDGPGFNAQAVSPDHFGLAIMRERAEAIGAVLQVESSPGSGTTVMVVWAKDK
jgi:signal transduction histidine kinase